MYPAILDDAMDEETTRAIVGNVVVEQVFNEHCEFTGRVIDDCHNVVEMSASANFVDNDGDDRVLTIRYLIDKDSAMEIDDLGNLDYSDFTFTID